MKRRKKNSPPSRIIANDFAKICEIKAYSIHMNIRPKLFPEEVFRSRKKTLQLGQANKNKIKGGIKKNVGRKPN